MKKAWILFVLLSVVAVAAQASASSNTVPSDKFDSLAQGFSEEEKNLRETRGELWQLFKALGDNYIALVLYKLEAVEVVCGYEAHLVSSYTDVKDSAKQDYSKKAVAELEMAKKRMNQTLKGIEELRTYIPYPPALQQMDKAKGSVEASIGLTDEAIGTFQSLTK